MSSCRLFGIHPLEVVLRDVITILILYESGGFFALVNRRFVRVVEYLTVAQINEDFTSSHSWFLRRQLRGTILSCIDRRQCCFTSSVPKGTELTDCSITRPYAVGRKIVRELAIILAIFLWFDCQFL